MSLFERAAGGAVVLMAVCCFVLPLTGGIVAGGLLSTGSVAGFVGAVVVIGVLVVFAVRKRRDATAGGDGCGC